MKSGKKIGSSKVLELRRVVEDLRRTKEKIQNSEKTYRFLIENLADSIWQLDEQFRFVYVAPSVQEIGGYRTGEMLGRHLFEFLTPDSIETVQRGYAARKPLIDAGQRWSGSPYTVQFLHKDGEPIWVEVMVNPIFDAENRLKGYNGSTRDISERRRGEEVIRQFAFQDPLTKLPNRRRFEDELEKAIARGRQMNEPLAILFIDLDGLKKINDSHGHAAGDVVLKVQAEWIRQAVRKMDIVARLGGDEFVVILPDIGDVESAVPIAARLIEVCHQPIPIGEKSVSLGASIGICFFPSDAVDATMLMKCADQAMYRAKESGGCDYVFYNQIDC